MADDAIHDPSFIEEGNDQEEVEQQWEVCKKAVLIRHNSLTVVPIDRIDSISEGPKMANNRMVVTIRTLRERHEFSVANKTEYEDFVGQFLSELSGEGFALDF